MRVFSVAPCVDLATGPRASALLSVMPCYRMMLDVNPVRDTRPTPGLFPRLFPKRDEGEGGAKSAHAFHPSRSRARAHARPEKAPESGG
ncbi:hypothetical protein D1O30_03190 [Methylocystis hirsuta]|uniref:Uncharacterized protein n=1 Tax=Methylocystis hirsuta TaxID=369798 RepID=A0A3M9XLR7_9HYPH|nr:hypothetical protein D1O30_03190 [Methylocystis hirsuta]